MTLRPLTLIGNLTCMFLAIAGLQQYLSWTIAGSLIIVVLFLVTLSSMTNLSPRGSAGGHPASKKSGVKVASIETRSVREKTQEKQPIRPHVITPKPDQRSLPRSEAQRSTALQARPELQKAMAPKIVQPKTIPTSASPGMPDTRHNAATLEALRLSDLTPVGLAQGRQTPSKPDPNTRVLARGDYASFEVKLDRGLEAVCEVTASGPVNVYLLNRENLSGLDLGEEFWSETGEEGVAKATLDFVAPENGDWFLVVENTDNKEATATVHITKRQSKSKPNANIPP